MTVNLAKSYHKVPQLPWGYSIRNEIIAVEDCLKSLINSAVPTAFDLSRHLLTAGGKRLRPALVLLSAKTCGDYDPVRATNIAACCEMIHMATLVHDDVVDQTDSRRGRSTANAFWGNKISVLSGDFLLSKAFAILSLDGDLRIMREISQMTVVMSESEVLQAVCEGNLAAWEEHYWEIVTGKTAGFMESCCKLGAMLAGASDDVIDALGQFGEYVGIAFQITDDLLDVSGDPEETGKPVGNDLREGKATLPVLTAIKEADDATRSKLLGLLNASVLTPDDIRFICDTIVACGAVEKVRKIASEYADKALQILESFPESEARTGLQMLVQNLVYRSF